MCFCDAGISPLAKRGLIFLCFTERIGRVFGLFALEDERGCELGQGHGADNAVANGGGVDGTEGVGSGFFVVTHGLKEGVAADGQREVETVTAEQGDDAVGFGDLQTCDPNGSACDGG